MDKIYLALDYDDVDLDKVFSDFTYIYRIHGIGLALYTSSKEHYHIRSTKPIDFELAFSILNISRCSHQYKNFCTKVGKFPIRVSEKVKTFSNGEHLVSPLPILLLSVKGLTD